MLLGFVCDYVGIVVGEFGILSCCESDGDWYLCSEIVGMFCWFLCVGIDFFVYVVWVVGYL